MVWYYREPASGTPPQQAEDVIKLVIEQRLAIVDVHEARLLRCRSARRNDETAGDVHSSIRSLLPIVRMAIRIVRFGTPRSRGEGLRLGTVRRPPRGVPKSEYAARDFYDVWVPELAPSAELVKTGLQAHDEREWRGFAQRYRAEMKRSAAARLIALLAAFSRHANFAVGCYCADESRCHRSILKALLREHGALVD